MNRIMQSKCVAAAIVAAALCSAFGAVWHDGDLTVVKGDPVTLTDKNMTNSCLVLHDNFTVKLGDKAHKYLVSSICRQKDCVLHRPALAEFIAHCEFHW